MKTDSNILNLSTLGDMGLYVHIPFCKQKCMYCDFPAYQNLQDYYETYVYALVQEIDLWVSEHPESKAKPIDTIYFGGGTPTELSIQQLQMIVDKIKSTFTITDDCHMTIESNPGEVDLQYLTKLVKLGFNRISFGVQTFDDKALIMLHRSHDGEKAKQAVYEAKEAGFTDINIDLIYGLPRQTLEDIQHNLHILKDLPINEGIRRSNNRNVMPYIQAVDRYTMPTIETETITVERAQEDFCFLALRTKWGLDEQKFDDRFGVSVHNLFGNILEDLVTKGLLEYQNGSYYLSSEGAKHGNYVFSQFIRE